MWIFRCETACVCADIGKVAATAARDQYLLSNRVCMIDKHGLSTALACSASAHQARSASTEDYHVKIQAYDSLISIYALVATVPYSESKQ
jgi:hypothetical protein